MFTGIELLNMTDSTVRVICCKRKKGLLKVENTLEASFNSPFDSITHKDVKRFFKQHNLKPNKLLLMLPNGFDRSMIWQESVTEVNRRKEIQVKMNRFAEENKEYLKLDKDTSINTGFLGEADGVNYGMVSAVPCNGLDKLYKAFKNYDLKYVLPRIAGFSLIRFTPRPKYSSVLDMGQNALDFAVYSGNVLIWYQSLPYSGSPEHSTFNAMLYTVLQAVTAARNKYIYPTAIYLTGDFAGIEGMSDKLSEELEIRCRISDDYSLEPTETGFLSLLSIMKEISRLKPGAEL